MMHDPIHAWNDWYVSGGTRDTRKKSIEQLKRDAKRLKKQESITHAEALDRIAQQHGFKNWAALMRAQTEFHS